MNRLGIEFLSVFGLPPVDFVKLAADLGCTNISSGVMPIPFNPFGFSDWSLRDDPQLRREMRAAMQDRQVVISLGEGFAVRSDADVESLAGDLDIMGELGVKRINTVAMDPNRQRCVDQIGKLVDMARSKGMQTTLEFAPGMTIADLPTALEAVRQVNRPEFSLLIDTMHFFRSGGQVPDLAALAPELIGYVQINDVSLTASHPDYMQEAMFERLMPGDGELPLAELLAAIPADRVVSLEVPNRSQSETGQLPVDWLDKGVRATRQLLDQV